MEQEVQCDAPVGRQVGMERKAVDKVLQELPQQDTHNQQSRQVRQGPGVHGVCVHGDCQVQRQPDAGHHPPGRLGALLHPMRAKETRVTGHRLVHPRPVGSAQEAHIGHSRLFQSADFLVGTHL